MAASEHTRPRTRRTDQPRRGEIVWDDALGWGIVVEAGDEGRLVWTRARPDPAIEEFVGNDRRPTVTWPDAGRIDVQRAPVSVVLEPVKLLGAIERTIDPSSSRP